MDVGGVGVPLVLLTFLIFTAVGFLNFTVQLTEQLYV
jgi:hypothetical protein